MEEDILGSLRSIRSCLVSRKTPLYLLTSSTCGLTSCLWTWKIPQSERRCNIIGHQTDTVFCTLVPQCPDADGNSASWQQILRRMDPHVQAKCTYFRYHHCDCFSELYFIATLFLFLLVRRRKIRVTRSILAVIEKKTSIRR